MKQLKLQFFPDPLQKEQINLDIRGASYVYNHFINNINMNNTIYTRRDAYNEIRILKKENEKLKWLDDVDRSVLRNAIRDAYYDHKRHVENNTPIVKDKYIHTNAYRLSLKVLDNNIAKLLTKEMGIIDILSTQIKAKEINIKYKVSRRVKLSIENNKYFLTFNILEEQFSDMPVIDTKIDMMFLRFDRDDFCAVDIFTDGNMISTEFDSVFNQPDVKMLCKQARELFSKSRGDMGRAKYLNKTVNPTSVVEYDKVMIGIKIKRNKYINDIIDKIISYKPEHIYVQSKLRDSEVNKLDKYLGGKMQALHLIHKWNAFIRVLSERCESESNCTCMIESISAIENRIRHYVPDKHKKKYISDILQL